MEQYPVIEVQRAVLLGWVDERREKESLKRSCEWQVGMLSDGVTHSSNDPPDQVRPAASNYLGDSRTDLFRVPMLAAQWTDDMTQKCLYQARSTVISGTAEAPCTYLTYHTTAAMPSAQINQPSNQIKLTNVSLVRIKKGKLPC